MGGLYGECLGRVVILVGAVVATGTTLAEENPAEAPKDLRLPPVFLPSFVKEHAAMTAKLRGAKETDRFPDWLSVLRAAEK